MRCVIERERTIWQFVVVKKQFDVRFSCVGPVTVSYTHLRAHETSLHLVCRLLLEKFVLTILELNWNQRLEHKKSKLNICHHMLTSSTQLQNRSFRVVERTRTSSKCQKIKKCTCKACKNTVFHCQICKFGGFLLLSSSWLLQLPNVSTVTDNTYIWVRKIMQSKIMTLSNELNTHVN